MPAMVQTNLHGQWPLLLPPHRAVLPAWTEPPYWEAERIASMHANLQYGQPRIVDVGAEEGDMPALWASWGCDVILVEPDPFVWPNIRAIFEANDLPILDWFVGFASDKTVLQPPQMEAIIAEPARDDWPACAYGPIIGDHGFRTIWERAHDTPQVTIDDLRDRAGPLDAITMDIEGAELVALRGARVTLENDRPLVWVSEHPDFMGAYGYGQSDLWRYMEGLDYERYHLATDHEVHAFYVPADHQNAIVPEGGPC